MIMEKIMTMETIAFVIMTFSITIGVITLVTASSKKYFYLSTFVIHITLSAITKILITIDHTPGITALTLTPMKLAHWYCQLISFYSILAVLLIGILFDYRARKSAAAENQKASQEKD